MDNTEKQDTYKRSHFLINMHFQIYWILWVILMALGIVICFSLAMCAYLVITAQAIPSIDQGQFFDQGNNHFMPYSAIVIFAVLMFLFISLLIRRTHAVAGPIYRFMSFLKAVNDGNYDLPDIHLRKGDNFADLANQLNDVLSSCRCRRETAKESARVLSENLDALEKTLDINDSAAAGEIRECLSRLRKVTGDLAKL